MAQKLIMRTIFIILGVFVLALGVSAGLCVNVHNLNEFKKSDKIAAKVVVDDNKVGGLTLNEAEKILEKQVASKLSRTIMVKVGDKVYKPTYKILGYSYDIQGTLNKAYNLGRSGNYYSDFMAVKGINDYNLTLDMSRDSDAVKNYVTDLANKTQAKPKDASLYRKDGKIYVTPSETGLIIDIEKSIELLTDALNTGKSEVAFPVVKNYPKVTAESLNKINTKLSTYSTNYNSGKVGRSANLALACKKINSTVVAPGDVFSFNKVVGPRTAATGFKNAIIFEQGQEIEGIGGGICQVSSTLFNAALLGGFEIAQRRSHSLKVAYVPLGRDAMVSYGSSDFKFKNNCKYPVVIFANASGGKLNMEIWGNSGDKKKCSVSQSTGKGGYYASITRYVEDANGNKKATYTASSVYQRPKPKTESKPKPKTNQN